MDDKFLSLPQIVQILNRLTPEQLTYLQMTVPLFIIDRSDAVEFLRAHREAVQPASADDIPENPGMTFIMRSIMRFTQQELYLLRREVIMKINGLRPQRQKDNSQPIGTWGSTVSLNKVYFDEYEPSEVLTPPELSEPLGRANELWKLAFEATRTKDQVEAQRLLDEAIAFAEEHNVPSFEMKLYRNYRSNRNTATFLKAVNYYRIHSDPVKFGESVENFAEFLAQTGDKERALGLLDEAERALEAITPETLAELYKYHRLFQSLHQNEIFIHIRITAIKRRRKEILSE